MSRLRHPVRAIREPFGKAGLTVAICALVLAMVGGAYAAGALSGKQKKEVEKIAKKFAGKPGATGAAGANGTNGTNGKDGAPGTAGIPGTPGKNGTDGEDGEPGEPGEPGANGKSVLHGTGAPSAGTGNEGEFYLDTATDELYGPKVGTNWGSGTKLKGEKGEDGSPWTLGGTLPASTEPGCPCTETGTWGFPKVAKDVAASGTITVPVASFTIPLAAPLGAGQVHYINQAGKEINNEAEEVDPSIAGACLGSAASPSAEPGNLCIYVASENVVLTAPFYIQPPGGGGEGAGTAGAVQTFIVTEGALSTAQGTWAVTAE
jgi:hypothetical protein